jgi:hypothetical protein
MAGMARQVGGPVVPTPTAQVLLQAAAMSKS